MKRLIAVVLSVLLTGCSSMPVQSRIDRYEQMQNEWKTEVVPAVTRRERETFKNTGDWRD